MNVGKLNTVNDNNKLNMMTNKDKMISAVTQFDARASKKKGYNPHALGIYLQRIDEVCADIERGADIRRAIIAGFSGRIADCILKSVELPLTNTTP